MLGYLTSKNGLMGQHKVFYSILCKIVVMVTVQAVPHVNLDVDQALKEDQEARMGKRARCRHWQSKLMGCARLCSSEGKAFSVFSRDAGAFTVGEKSMLKGEDNQCCRLHFRLCVCG